MRIHRILLNVKYARNTLRILLIVILMGVAGCTALTMAKDVVLWAPKKVLYFTGKAWDATGGRIWDATAGKLTYKGDEWQKELELGPRRSPRENPNRSPIPGAGQPYGQAPQGPYAYPPQYGQPQPYGNFPQAGTIPYPQQQGVGNYPGGLQPQFNQQYSPGLPSGSFGGGYSAQPYDDAGEAFLGRGKKKKSLNPFSSGQRFIRKFEPMAMEFSIDGRTISEAEARFEPLDLEVYMSKGPDGIIISQNNSEETSPSLFEDVPQTKKIKSKNMFPLEEYAPKSNILINNFSNSPALGKQQQIHVDKNKLNAEIDALIKKLDTKKHPLPSNEQAVNDEKTMEEKLDIFDADSLALDDTLDDDINIFKEKVEAIDVPSSLSIKDITPETADKIILGSDKGTIKQKPLKKKNLTKPILIGRKKQNVKKQEEIPSIPDIMPLSSAPIIAKIPGITIKSPPIVELTTRKKRNRRISRYANPKPYKGVLPKSRYSGRRKVMTFNSDN